MLVQEKIGNLKTFPIAGRRIDWLLLEWYETEKRIQRKKTTSGREIALRFLKENPNLQPGDILWEDQNAIIAIDIIPADCIVIGPRDLHEMAAISYEIGNKHLPLFYEKGTLLVPHDEPLLRLFKALGYDVSKEKRILSGALKTTVSPHGSNSSLFDTIMQLTRTES